MEDAADGLLALARHDTPEPLNIGTGKEVSIAELAKAIVAATGFEGELRFDPSKPDGQPRKVMDCGLAERLIGWTAPTSLEEGLAQTVSWYKEQLGC